MPDFAIVDRRKSVLLNGNYGIPATQSVITTVFPDFYTAQTQQQFAPFFAALSIQRVIGASQPIYNVRAVCHSGAILTAEVAT